MELTNSITKWLGRNWPLATTCAVLFIGLGVLLFRSSEFDNPSAAEAAVIGPSSAVMVPGETTVITPAGDAAAALVSNEGTK